MKSISFSKVRSKSKPPSSAKPEEAEHDLGFGTRVAQQSKHRLLNHDGTFNVERGGLPLLQRINPYHVLLTMSWTRFIMFLAAMFVMVNLLFAVAYTLSGPGALGGADTISLSDRIRESFFFSVQTLSTVRYGHRFPLSIVANIIMTVESFVGMMGYALGAGIVFAGFSRPRASVVFSERAIVMPYREVTAFAFRIVNGRSNELVDVKISVVISMLVKDGGRKVRRFHEMKLERTQVEFFPVHWVVVHPIDGLSPLNNLTAEEFEAADPEVDILLTAFDETFSQTVHARSSYKHQEIIWGARFGNIFEPSDDGRVRINVKNLHAIDRVVG